jgi:hypothetical protein
MYLLSRMNVNTTYWQATGYMLICGLGLGPTFPLYTLAVQNAVDRRYIGQATGTSIFFRQIGGTVGVAIMGTVLATVLTASFAAVPTFRMQPVKARDPSAMQQALDTGSVQDIRKVIRAQFDRQYALAQRALLFRDPRALRELLNDPHIPPQGREQLQLAAQSGGDYAQQELAMIRTTLLQQADLAIARASLDVRTGFAHAVTRIFFYIIFFILAGLAITFFVPELPLRKTQEGGGPPGAAA